MPNPVRIYVLHHPDSTTAAELTDRIYDWFRLPSLEGIPVYVRSVAANDDGQPLLPSSDESAPSELEYLIPLIDCHMVRDPVWHDYLTKLAERCDNATEGAPGIVGWHMFPVALDSSAFNLPRLVTRRNFIRHGTGNRPKKITPDATVVFDTEETLKHLTEAMARDLSGRLFPEQTSPRFKIFISYSRADSTAIAKALRDYIQGETQCQVFLDENDIAYGQAFAEDIEKNLDGHARAMIVINGDNYADRPWCRWEISKFTSPRMVPLNTPPKRSAKSTDQIHFFQPLLVVDAVKGPTMTRVLPELSQAPMVRWEPGRAKLCFSILMREVLLGLRDVLVARLVLTPEDLKDAVVVNRLPGPVAIEQILRANHGSAGRSKRRNVRTIHYPGNGLPLIELRLLKRTFGDITFRAFRDIMRDSAYNPGSQTAASAQRHQEQGAQAGNDAKVHGTRAKTPVRMHQKLECLECGGAAELPMRGKVIAISSSYSKRELAALGYLPQHQDEALIHLLRPLVRMGADILYGGLPPKTAPEKDDAPSQSTTRNLTTTLLQLLADERREDDERVGVRSTTMPRGSVMFNVSTWPDNTGITPKDEAMWINICRVLRVTPEDANLPPWSELKADDKNNPPENFRRYAALTLSEMRRRLAKSFRCRVPVDGECSIEPSAYVFIGGDLSDFTGVMPGIMEEFLHAAKTGRPIYLIGGLGGAAGAIARALCSEQTAPRPPEFTVEYYRTQKAARKVADYIVLLEELEAAGDPKPGVLFDELWSWIEENRGVSFDQLFRNGLSHQENKKLITSIDTSEAVRLIWEGLNEAPNMHHSCPAPKPSK